MEQVSPFALVGLAVALCSGHLFIGLALGWSMGRKGTFVGSEPVSLEPFAMSVERMRVEMGELSRLSLNIPAPDREFTSLIARLTLSLDELHRSLSNPNPTVPTTPPAPDEHSHQMGTHAVGNGRILEWFSESNIGRVASEGGRRYPFAVQQFVAERKSDELPKPGDFTRVQCHDICPGELRYITDHRPKVQEVVVGLGLPRPVKFLTAQIEDFRSVYMYGRVGYLVTAKFEAALDHPPYHAYAATGVDSERSLAASN